MANAIVAYVPAIHQGYFKFFEKHPGDIFLLGESLLAELPRLDRDVRALKPKQVAKMLSAELGDRKVAVLDDLADLSLLQAYDAIVLPDEDISHHFAKTHLTNLEHAFSNVFLRWDKRAATYMYQAPADRKVSTRDRDRELMGKAFADAQRSPDWWRQVGAVITINDEQVLIGHNRPLANTDFTLDSFGDPRANFNAGEFIEISKAIHGEAALIAEAARRGLKLEGASIYASTFPCPNCAKLIAVAGIKRVYYTEGYSLLDANDIFAEYGIEAIFVEQEKSPSALKQTGRGRAKDGS